MITLSTAITTQPVTYSGVWVNNINITSPAANSPISAQIRVTPLDLTTGNLAPFNMGKTINIRDVAELATSSSLAANAMTSIMAFVQDYIISKSVF